jgi:hypothetical protein
MSAPTYRIRPGFSGVWGACLLLSLGLAACQTEATKLRPDADGRETGRADGSAWGSDLLGASDATDAALPEDGRSVDGIAVGDGADDSASISDANFIHDAMAFGLDARTPPPDDVDAPVDGGELDVGVDAPFSGTEPLDSGSGAGGSSDGAEVDSALDAVLNGNVDGPGPGAFDVARDSTDTAPDSPVAEPDVAPDGTDARDAALPDSSPDARDAAAVDGSAGLDSRDGSGADGNGGDGADGGGPCCGCLCRDPSWSCSRETCLDSTGHALTLAAEAGFFELAGGSYVSEGQTRTSPTHRIWYSFQPAVNAPESKPLAVFFNGGPGSATSVYLFALNTAPFTLDPAFTGTAKIATNANSWAQFANLLYVDAPGTGFSYPLALAGGSKPNVNIDLDREAGAVLRVILRFLARHPRLQANPVVIVGESYGGTRSTLLLDHIYTYQTLAGTTAAYRDMDVYNDLVAHFATVWPGDNPQAIPAAKLATQFGWQVLIQPVVAGNAQYSLKNSDTSMCRPSPFDAYQCNQASDWSDQLEATVGQRLTTIATLRQALGVDPTTIAWLYANARTTAYGRDSGVVFSAPEMTTTFGTLASGDNYLLAWNSSVASSYGRGWSDSNIGRNFLADLVYVNTFITNAKYDTVVWTPAIAQALATYTDLVSSSTIDGVARMGIVRPGWIKVTYAQGVIPAPNTREIRFPIYAEGGHMVSVREPANLLADVMQWYGATPLASSPAHGLRPEQTVTVSAPLPSAEPSPYIGP